MAKKRKNKARKKKRKVKLQESEGIVHIKASFNNTIVTITDMKGNVIAWASGGKIGYKGSRKSTSYAAKLTSTEVAKDVLNMGLKKVHIELKGPGSGRDSAVRSIQAAGLEVLSITDITPIPHNGCRPPKKRRI
ncbi:MAG: 30S ribosomal protein S11 [Candidatus Cloacimonetes bacterium]|nr:30S ribosomal protein S11 [Candidatus Cloacimonadota bacterium]MBS3766939.1 30S ribosomal protein S11 [Candidatus Cloacimonadota bacterium]